MKWEAMPLFHVTGDRLEPERLLAKHSLTTATPFRKGETGPEGRLPPLEFSGFKVDLGAFTSMAAFQEGVLGHLQAHSKLYEEAAKEGGRISLGIFLTVPSKEPRTLTLTPEVLAVFLKFGITVHVTGYPAINDPDAEAGQR